MIGQDGEGCASAGHVQADILRALLAGQSHRAGPGVHGPPERPTQPPAAGSSRALGDHWRVLPRCHLLSSHYLTTCSSTLGTSKSTWPKCWWSQTTRAPHPAACCPSALRDPWHVLPRCCLLSLVRLCTCNQSCARAARTLPGLGASISELKPDATCAGCSWSCSPLRDALRQAHRRLGCGPRLPDRCAARAAQQAGLQ